jgi:methyl-accepting chemotaxis protein
MGVYGIFKSLQLYLVSGLNFLCALSINMNYIIISVLSFTGSLLLLLLILRIYREINGLRNNSEHNKNVIKFHKDINKKYFNKMGELHIKDKVVVQNNKDILDSILYFNERMEQNNKKNANLISKNSRNISKNNKKNSKNISDNSKNISGFSKNISDNSNNISDNSNNISDNSNNISDNSNNISENLQRNTGQNDMNERRVSRVVHYFNNLQHLLVGVEKNTLNHLKNLSNKIDEEFDTISEADEFDSVLQKNSLRNSFNGYTYTLIENDMMS